MTRWSLSSGSAPGDVEQVDVVVIGGGAAGVAAAVTCADDGLSTVLVERYGFCGGGAVAGLSGTVCGLYNATESADRLQLVTGFTERFCQLLASKGGLTDPLKYGKTWTRVHDPHLWRETADDLLTAAGVRVLFHTQLIDVVVESERVVGVVLESKDGCARIGARRVIDASGDGAVIARAGGAWRCGADGRVQNPTMIFRLGNVDVEAFSVQFVGDTICPPSVTEALQERRRSGADLPREKIWIFPTPRPGELLVNATRLTKRDGGPLNPLDPDDLSWAEIAGRRQVREYAAFCAETISGCSESFVVDTGVEVGVRQTRSVEGVATLRNDDVVTGRKRPDGIVRSAWPIELHDGDSPKLHWLIDDYYEVPYLALVPRGLAGVVVAGRCLSAEHEALASARVTAQCFEYGKAAGTATILSLADDQDYCDIPGEAVRRRMRETGSSL